MHQIIIRIVSNGLQQFGAVELVFSEISSAWCNALCGDTTVSISRGVRSAD